jgi:hypothetical protein
MQSTEAYTTIKACDSYLLLKRRVPGTPAAAAYLRTAAEALLIS